jgi:regulatory protein
MILMGDGMEIQKITKLNNGLYELQLEMEGLVKKFQLTEEFLIQNHLFSNQPLTFEQYERIIQSANQSRIYTQVLNYLSYKMRSEKEISDYLNDKECEPTYKREIIEKLKKLNYINDERYTEIYVKQYVEINKKGPLWIKNQLIKKGIAIPVIEREINKLNQQVIQDNVTQMIAHYNKVNKKKTIPKLKESILKNLLTKGFGYEDVIDLINQYEFSKPVNEDALLAKELQKIYLKYSRKLTGYELKTKLIQNLLQKGFTYEAIEEAYQALEETS